MGTAPEMKEPYLATLKEDWESMTKFYEKHDHRLLFPITISKDTALHMAVYSGNEKLLKYLLDAAQQLPLRADDEHPIYVKNIYENTPLHMAAYTGNIEAVKLLVEESKKISGDGSNILLKKNKYGETPLFRAAAFGQTEIVKYLTEQPAQKTLDNKLLVDHCQRDDFQSIIHLAVLGEYFDTALLLLKLDSSLGELTDRRGRTCLYLLAKIPSAFKSGYSMSTFQQCLYWYLPVEDGCNNDEELIDGQGYPRVLEAVESGHTRNADWRFSSYIHKVLKAINLSVCRFFFKGWPMVERIWEHKRKHKFALGLAKMLIKNDNSWDQQITVLGWEGVSIGSSVYGPQPIQVEEEDEEGFSYNPPHPLFTATRTGILEIVYGMLEEHPQAVELLNTRGQNILHVAVMYRRNEIFHLLKSNRILLARMSSRIDNKGYTLLHQVADNKYYSGGSKAFPALQLQEELEWFKRVKKVVPSYYAKHRDFQHDMTAEELFRKKHKSQLQAAQQWIKETAQSCSAVAVLVATIVFAAAYTVPGGSNEKGIPIFLHKSFFLFFTIMDVVALASSLTSVVMFLSILTSPFEYEDFHYSIPRKLTLGFTLLFFSVMTTMLAFAATILLIIQMEKHWTAGLISIAAFFPVSIFALMQFRLYSSFLGSMKGFLSAIRRSLPWFCVPSLFRERKQYHDFFRKL